MSKGRTNVFGCLCVLIAFLGIRDVQGQKNITRTNQQWIQYYNTAKIHKNWVIKTDGGYRLKNNFSNPSQYIARIAVAYRLEPHHMQFAAGFANLGFYAGDSLARIEMRPYIGLVINDKYPRFKIQHRLRAEYRSFKTLSTGSVRDNMRFRYRFYLNVPLLKLSQKNKSMALSWNLGDEVFINGGRNIVYNVFNQNRLLTGPRLQISRNLSATLTYTSEFGSTTVAGNYRYSNIWWLGIQHKLDFTNTNRDEKGAGSGSGSGKGNGGGFGTGDGSGNEKGSRRPKNK